MGNSAAWIVMGCAASAVFLSWGYFQRYQMTRPPLGVINLWDVTFMIGAIVMVPYLYMALPTGIVVVLIALALASILYSVGEPVLRARRIIWPVVLVVLGADVFAARSTGTTSSLFWIVNDAVLILAVTGITNLWAQSGMAARDVAVLAGALAVYDGIATSLLPVTNDFIVRLAENPFVPLVAWGAGQDRLGLGLGDLLLATVFPLVMHKAFGHAAGLVALVTSLATIGALLALMELRGVEMTFPVMVSLGPLMVVQFLSWRRRCSQERTTGQYRSLQALPSRERAS